MTPGPLLEVAGLEKRFDVGGAWLGRRRAIRAVDGVSFALEPGATLGLVGESGCGKSTTARLILRLIEPSGGTIRFEGRDLLALSAREQWAARQRMQIVFQDPLGSLNPRMRVGTIVGEPIQIYGTASAAARRARVAELLDVVGMDAALHMSDRVAVMYLGEIVEIGPRDAALLSAVPVPDPSLRRERVLLKGEVASPLAVPPGCRFHPRCSFAFDR